MVERLIHLGFEDRAELLLGDGQRLQAAEELAQGEIVYVRPSQVRVFSN
jgi:hypothetical protein